MKQGWSKEAIFGICTSKWRDLDYFDYRDVHQWNSPSNVLNAKESLYSP